MVKVKEGDLVIRKGKHSCDIRFVEGADETGILLVNGIKDEFYEPKEFDLFEATYQMLCRRESRLDIH